MSELTAKRTLVKSPPELWEELSEVERLAKHLGAFGEITITKLEPEHTVAWEGEHASGTVSIEPSGWGTKVTLHAELPHAEPEREPEPEAVAAEPPAVEPEPQPAPEPDKPISAALDEASSEEAPERPRRGFWGWLFRSRTARPAAGEPEPEPVAPEPEPEPAAPEPEPEPVAVLREPVAVEPASDADSDPLPGAERAELDGDAPLDPERARRILDEALDALGAAHHRPFSRG